MLQGVGNAFADSRLGEDFNEMTVGPGDGFGIHGFGRNHDSSQQVMIGNSPKQHEGRVSLRFDNIGNYQRHHPTQESVEVTVGGKPARKRAGKLYKPFHSGVGANTTSTRRDRSQSRQGQVPTGQRQSYGSVQKAGRRWESSTYSQQAHGATFYDLLKHNNRSARAQQQTVTLLGDSTGVKLPPI